MTSKLKMDNVYLVKYDNRFFPKNSLVSFVTASGESFLVEELSGGKSRGWMDTCDLYRISLEKGESQSRWHYDEKLSLLGKQLFSALSE